MARIEFGQLPKSEGFAPRRRSEFWDDVALQLMENPHRWARVISKPEARIAAGVASQIRMGKLAAFAPRGTFEAASRGKDVWARYVGQ